jgi:DNA-binding FadR family transcriptional regulator
MEDGFRPHAGAEACSARFELVISANQAIQVAPVGFEEVRELYEMRLHGERLAWRLWHKRRTDADIETLSRTFEAAERLIAENRTAEIINLDFDFRRLASCREPVPRASSTISVGSAIGSGT